MNGKSIFIHESPSIPEMTELREKYQSKKNFLFTTRFSNYVESQCVLGTHWGFTNKGGGDCIFI